VCCTVLKQELSEIRHSHVKLKKTLQDRCAELEHARSRAEQYEAEVKKLRSRIEELKAELSNVEDEVCRFSHFLLPFVSKTLAYIHGGPKSKPPTLSRFARSGNYCHNLWPRGSRVALISLNLWRLKAAQRDEFPYSATCCLSGICVVCHAVVVVVVSGMQLTIA